MSDTDTTPPQVNGENGAEMDPNAQMDPNAMPQVAALTQYIKDLSVENPNSPAVYQWQEGPQLDVQFNIAANRVGDDVHEVILKIMVKAASSEGAHFVVDLAYGGLFGLRNIPEDALAPFMLIEAPRLLFPFARQIIADQTQNLGFPAVLLDPIDFASAYMAQLAQQGEGLDAPADEPVGHA